jgi:hypothetical protein
MAKRASLSFDAVKSGKGAQAAEPAPAPAADAGQPAPKRGRGRPEKRPAGVKVYGMTLRVPGDLRRALRRLAEQETDAGGKVVSVHDVILQAVEAHLARKGVKLGE